jgi:hypothetical protein
MIVGTKSGLLIFESTLLYMHKKTEPEVHMSVKYKISALPDEQVVDLAEAGESKVLVCCYSGSYVILDRAGSMMQEIWRFRGFSLPPKSFLATGDSNKVLIVENEGLAIIDLKRKSIIKCKRKDLDVLKTAVGLYSCALVGQKD